MAFGDANVDLWCPQTEDFESHAKGSLQRKGGIDKDEFENFVAFRNWKAKMCRALAQQREDPTHQHHKRPYHLKSVHISSVTRFSNGMIGFVKMDAWIQRDPYPEHEEKQETASGAVDYANTLFENVFLRGGRVAVLMILRAKEKPEDRWVVLTKQPRVPTCSLRFVEIPAGMMDGNTFKSAAVREIEEETGLTVPESELINMSELARRELGKYDPRTEETQDSLESAMYSSPGGCDEYISLLLWEKEMEFSEIEALRGKFTGLRSAGEMITLRLVKYADLWKIGAQDGKTMASLALCRGLKDAGILPID
ncbi:unnamed protein product [Discula destructiva]